MNNEKERDIERDNRRVKWREISNQKIYHVRERDILFRKKEKDLQREGRWI